MTKLIHAFYNMDSIDTTRIYIMTTGTEHRRKIERLGLVV